MDPTVCMERLIKAIMDDDWTEAREAIRDLREWRAGGGFAPDYREACNKTIAYFESREAMRE